MPTFNNTKIINLTQSDYTSARPSNGEEGEYDRSIRFANKTVTLDLGDTDYGMSVFQVTYTGTLDYVSVGFFDPNGGFVSVSQDEDGLYKPVKTSLVLNEYILKNDGFTNPTNVFYVIVNIDDTIKSNILNVCVSMGKRGTPPTTSSATILYNCPIPLYEYETGLHVYSPYDAIAGQSKLTTNLYSKTPIGSWVENTIIYASKGFNNPALPYYYGYGDYVYKVGGVFDRSYGTQMETTVTKKLFRKPRTTEEIFGPQLWFNPTDQTSDACTIPFIEGVGRLRSVVNKTTLSKPEQYRYYMGYDLTKKINSNDNVFRLYSMSDNNTYAVPGSTHALNKVLFGVVKGYDRSWNVNDWRTASTILGLSMLAPLGAAISSSSIGTTVAAWFESLAGGFQAWGFAETALFKFLEAAFWNFYALAALIVILILIAIFAKKTKRYRENCAKFLHHFTDTPYIEVSDQSHDTVLYRTPTLQTVNDGYYCDGVYFYRQTGGKIISKELSYTFSIKHIVGLFIPEKLVSMKADDPTLVTSYNKLIVLSYTSGKPLPHCGTGTIYRNNGNLTHTVIPNCCDLEIATETVITVENDTEFSCISQQDANDKALAVFNAAVDYAENYANYCKIIDDDLIGELNIRFTHELKIENTPTQANLFYDNQDGEGATIGKSIYFDASGCQKVLDGYYGVTGSTPFCTFYHTTNGIIDDIYYMSSSNSTTTTTGEPIVTTNLDYSSNWFLTNSNRTSLEYLTNSYDNDMSFDPNSLYTDSNLKKGFINNLETLDDFQIYDNFNTTSYSEASTGWYRPLIDWIGNDSFYYYEELTFTLNVEERCGSVFNRGFFVNSVLDGIPTTTTNPINMVVNVYTQNIGLSGTYNVKTSNISSSTFVNYGRQIGSSEIVTGITISNITTPNPLNKTTYVIGSSEVCYISVTPTPTPTPTVTPTPTISTTPEVVINNADYLVFKYSFAVGSGTDLDTLTTLYLNGNTSTPYTNVKNPVGFCNRGSTGVAASGKYFGPNMWYGGDNQLSSGTESVYVDIALLKTTTTVNSIQINCKANWYTTKGTGIVGIRMDAYSGGSMVSNAYGFTNSGGTLLGGYDFNPVTVTAVGAIGCNGLSCVGLYTYTLESGAFTVQPCV